MSPCSMLSVPGGFRRRNYVTTRGDTKAQTKDSSSDFRNPTSRVLGEAVLEGRPLSLASWPRPLMGLVGDDMLLGRDRTPRVPASRMSPGSTRSIAHARASKARANGHLRRVPEYRASSQRTVCAPPARQIVTPRASGVGTE